MTAEIIPFPRSIEETERRAALPVPFFAALPQPANSLPIDALPLSAYDGGDSVVAATIALSAACREMAASLAILIAHCKSADAAMAGLAGGADTAAEGGKAIEEASNGLGSDVVRAVTAVATAARAATQG